MRELHAAWMELKGPSAAVYFTSLLFYSWLQWRSLTWLITKHCVDFQQGHRYVFFFLSSFFWRDFADCCSKILVKGIVSVIGNLNTQKTAQQQQEFFDHQLLQSTVTKCPQHVTSPRVCSNYRPESRSKHAYLIILLEFNMADTEQRELLMQ